MANDLKALEKLLVCPVCRSKVVLVDRKFWCSGPDCRRSYPIDDQDIPHMLASEAVIEDAPATLPADPPRRGEH